MAFLPGSPGIPKSRQGFQNQGRNGSSMWFDGSVQGRQAVMWQKDRRPGTDRCIQLFLKLGGWASMGKGDHLEDREDWPSLWDLGRRLFKGPAQPLASLLASSGGGDETPSAFYFHKVFFLGEEAATLWKQQNAPHCGPQPEINLFRTLAFWFINM